MAEQKNEREIFGLFESVALVCEWLVTQGPSSIHTHQVLDLSKNEIKIEFFEKGRCTDNRVVRARGSGGWGESGGEQNGGKWGQQDNKKGRWQSSESSVFKIRHGILK